MPVERQLAAIMFTDIEGYSAIMQTNEDLAMVLKNRHREVLSREHSNFNGQIIQFYGDGTLSIFKSIVQALKCALAMQEQFRKSPEVPLRIGVHVGDIIFDDGNIFGDGVNIASRIQSLAEPGAILLSDRVNDEISNHPELKTVSLGVHHLKNIHRPVEVFALDHPDIAVPSTKKTFNTRHSAVRNLNASKIKNSVAVLPFLNLSNDPDQDYFGEGVAAEILNSLSGIKQLKVAGRASTFQFHGKAVDLKEIGKKLGVTNVLEGSIRKQSNRVRVTVQLVNTENGFQVWSERYDRDLNDIFRIQDEIALSVTEKLKIFLIEAEKKKIARTATKNTEAFELYLKGRFYVNRRAGAILTGIKYFQLAIELDPNYALAYAGYADANLMAASYGLALPGEAGKKAKEAADKAITLNPSLAEPYCSLGFYFTCCEWNWHEAEKNFLKSIELNPSYAQAHYWYGLNLLAWSLGDFANAEAHGRRAVELEPYSAICYGIYGPILHVQGKYEQTIEVCKRGMGIDPYAFLCNLYYGWSLVSMKQFEQGIPALKKLCEASKNHHFAEAALCIALNLQGDRPAAMFLYESLKQRSKHEYVGGTLIGLAAAHLGLTEEAILFLEKGFEARDPLLLSIKHEDWVPDVLKKLPYYQELLQRIGFL